MLSPGLELAKTMPGVTAPFGYFDPLRLTPEAPKDVLLWREAEVQHGRVAMMAAAGFIVQETGFHPLFSWACGPAAFMLDKVDSPAVVLSLLVPIFMAEVARAKKGWVEPDYTSDATSAATVRTLRDDYMPGDLGFDPLSLGSRDDPAAFLDLQNKELNNGRLAMFGAIGMLTGSYITGKGPLEVMTGGDVIVF